MVVNVYKIILQGESSDSVTFLSEVSHTSSSGECHGPCIIREFFIHDLLTYSLTTIKPLLEERDV